MKNIDDIIKRLPGNKLKPLAESLGIGSSTPAKITGAMVSVYGFHKLASSLSSEELQLLKYLYDGHDGTNLGDIQKATSIEASAIDSAVANLSDKLLVYVIKNRQLLNKNMDKVYCIKEVSNFLNLSATEELTSFMQSVIKTLINMEKEGNESKGKQKKDIKSGEILNYILENGNMASLDKLVDLNIKNFEKSLDSYRNDGILEIRHLLKDKITTVLSISPGYLGAAINSKGKSTAKKLKPVSNRFTALINAIHTYDIVSSSGLFLTKQGNFRKIDIKKIADRMMPLKDLSGEEISSEACALLAMQTINIMEILGLEKDIGVVNLKEVADKISAPVEMGKLLVSKLATIENRNTSFDNAIELPTQRDIIAILNLLQNLGATEITRLHTSFIASIVLEYLGHGEYSSKEQAWEINFQNALNFIILMGMADIEKNRFQISTEGLSLLHEMEKKKPQKAEKKEEIKSIVINPDFTLMVDERRISSTSLYTILSFAEVLTRDTIMQCAINKNSVIDANKRGMNISEFISTLRENAKNELPQNMEFLLQDWTNQTIKIEISRSILVHSNHPIFFDELSYSSFASIIKERISDNHIIIEKDSIDDLIKFSKKYDVVINIFETKDD